METTRCLRGDRLAYYRPDAGESFWGAHWDGVLKPGFYAQYRDGSLPMYGDVLKRHLPRAGKILEAGCGLGQVVLALRASGYDCEGIEYSEQTVEVVKEKVPGLPVRFGDVTAIDVPDGHYSGYVSLGVVEHRLDGPGPFLKEAWRVLESEGVAFFSVPYFNPLRRLKGKLGLYPGPAEGEFYQYAFSRREFVDELERHGFVVVETVTLENFKGLKDELPLFGALGRLPRVGSYFAEAIRRTPVIGMYVGHMIGFVCRKRKGSL